MPVRSSMDVNPGSVLSPVTTTKEELDPPLISSPFGVFHWPTLATVEPDMHCSWLNLPVTEARVILLF